MEETTNSKGLEIDLQAIIKKVWEKKWVYVKVLPVVFILSCIWVLPKPRYFNCDVKLAPEGGTEMDAGGLSSIASSFGISLGGGSSDAIYPVLYPDLFSDPAFIIDMFHIKVDYFDKKSEKNINTDYYTYLTRYQKKNPLTEPFKAMKRNIKNWVSPPKAGDAYAGSVDKLNPFHLSDKDYKLVTSMDERIMCSVDKKTNVITIAIQDQDPVVCASLADSVRNRLQTYITNYRTSKARQDVTYYKHLTDSIYVVYKNAMAKYSSYCDSNVDAVLQSYLSERDALENEMGVQYQAYTTMKAQLVAAQAKVQERTPVFTTLKSASVPVKPAGPKRMIFVAAMLFLATIITTLVVCRKLLPEVI